MSSSSAESKKTLSLTINYNQFFSDDEETQSKYNFCFFKHCIPLNESYPVLIQKVIVTSLYPHGGEHYGLELPPAGTHKPGFVELTRKMKSMYSEANQNLVKAHIISMENFQQGLVNYIRV